MKKIIFLFILFICFKSQAQTNLNWVFSSEGSSNGSIRQSFKCVNNDLLIMGLNYDGDIDPGPGNTTPFGDFFARYTTTGNIVFARPFCYNSNTIGAQGAMAKDNDDNFYYSFFGSGLYVFDTIAANGQLFIPTYSNALVKFDGMGNFKWAVICTQTIFGICTMSDGNLVLAGQVESSPVPVDIDPGPGVFMFNPQGTFEGVLTKFDSTGNFITAKEFHTVSGLLPDFSSLARVICDSADNVYFAIQLNGDVDLDPGPGITIGNGAAFPLFESYIVKLDPNLDFVFAHKMEGTMDYSFSIDVNNNLFICGYVDVLMDADPGPGVYMINQQNNNCNYVIKFSPSGVFQWVKTMNSTSASGLRITGFETDGSMYCILNSGDSLAENTFGFPMLPPLNTYPNYATYLAKLDAAGTPVFYFDLVSDALMENQSVIFYDPSHFYFTGRMWGPCDVRIGPGIYNIAPVTPSYNEFFISGYTLDTQINRIAGNSFIDINGDGVKNTGENGLPNAVVEIGSGAQFVSTNSNGDYTSYVPSGNYSIKVPTFPAGLSAPVPLVHNASFASTNQADTSNNFAFAVLANENEISTTITGYGAARPGFNYNYIVTYTNNGSTTQSGTVEVTLDPSISLVSSSITPTTITGNTLQWNYSGLTPFQVVNIGLVTSINSSTTIGSILTSNASITPLAGDVIPSNNYDTAAVTVTGSYDPNSMLVYPFDTISTSAVSAGIDLEYTILFQNTGNDTAFNVTILDTLSSLLNIASLKILSASHPFQFNLYRGNLIEFKFQNILLPDSNINETASHGFIKFVVRPLTTLTSGSLINNNAYIYFDYNLPILTNTVSTVIHNIVGINDLNNKSQLHVTPNPASNFLFIWSAADLQNGIIEIINSLGQKVMVKEFVGMLSENVLTEKLPNGIYTIKVISGANQQNIKFIIAH